MHVSTGPASTVTAAAQLWITLAVDGEVRDVRRLIVDGELGELVPARTVSDVLGMYQAHLTAIAAGRHWSVEILDPAEGAVVHIEAGAAGVSVSGPHINGRPHPVGRGEAGR